MDRRRRWWWQDLDGKGLMGSFMEVKRRHEGMEPEQFNDDGTYQHSLNEVCCSPQAASHAH